MKILYIEQGGENGDQWHEERHGCVTGTKFESAIGACFTSAKYKEDVLVTKERWALGGGIWEFDDNGKLTCIKQGKQIKKSRDKQITLMQELVSDRQSELEISDYCSAEMERGNELEGPAIEAVSKRHKVKFDKCGMLISESIPNFKFSPDAISLGSNGEVVVGGAETKSKMGRKHIQYQVEKAVPPEHLLQCLCPMVMSDTVKWWIFSHYDDRNKVNDLFTVGIKRADYEDFIQVARKVLIEFLNEVNEMVEQMGGAYND